MLSCTAPEPTLYQDYAYLMTIPKLGVYGLSFNGTFKGADFELYNTKVRLNLCGDESWQDAAVHAICALLLVIKVFQT